MNYYDKSLDNMYNEVKSTSQGLTTQDAEKRLEQYGPNALEEKKKKLLISKIWDQLNDPMVIILIVASVISGALGELADMIIILTVVLINTAVGLIQESKSEKAIEALKKMSAQQAKVVRDGKVIIVDASLLVPGDLIQLDAGDLIPADLRLIESSSLKIEEASLTGESVPSEKDASASVAEGSAIGDRINMAYYGTSVTYGRGKGIVVETGMKTEMGKIATMINNAVDELTPLQKKLAEIGKILTILVVFISVIIFLTGIFKNGGFTMENTLESFMIAVSIAVAAIPEGLPAIVTIVMAMGVTRMAKRRAIIKKLPAVETLGCAQIICSDKTGTLTQNKMDVKAIFTENQMFVSADYLEKVQDPTMLNILYLCNDSAVEANGAEVGDPTETCLKRYVLTKHPVSSFESKTRIMDLPFDSDRKMMSTVNDINGTKQVFTKGAPDELLKRCTHILINGNVVPIEPKHHDTLVKANKELAQKALRVLGTAFKSYDGNDNQLEQNLTFVGLVGMMDPPRPEVFDAIAKCKSAGITAIMITGDHKDTAIAIGKEIGIIENEDQAIFGNELNSMTDEQLDARLKNIQVYARVSPEHKVRIVDAWRRQGFVVAMTGDGVNDAPALKRSDIGIGMGITGTDVTKGVSDMLLADDNFATIVNAVEEGRIIYKNIRKAVQFLLSSNISEVLSLFLATLIIPAGHIFLSPVHILWINLVTDAFPAIGLGMDQAEEGIMEETPRDSRKSFFADGLGINIIYQGAILSILTLAAFFIGTSYSNEVGTTMAFVTLSTVQLFHSFNMRSQKASIFKRKLWDNPMMVFGSVVPMILMIILINVTAIGSFFKVVPLSLEQWAITIGLSFVIIPIVETVKFVRRIIEK